MQIYLKKLYHDKILNKKVLIVTIVKKTYNIERNHIQIEV